MGDSSCRKPLPPAPPALVSPCQVAHAIGHRIPQRCSLHASSQGLFRWRGSWVSRFARCEAGLAPAWLQPANSSNSWQDGVRAASWVLEMSSPPLAALGRQMVGRGELVWRRGCYLTSTSGSGRALGRVWGTPTLPSDTIFWARAAPNMAPLRPRGQGLLAHFSATSSVLFPLPLLGWGPQLSKAKWLEDFNNNRIIIQDGKSVKWETSSLPALNHCLFWASSPNGRSGWKTSPLKPCIDTYSSPDHFFSQVYSASRLFMSQQKNWLERSLFILGVP